MACVRPIRRVRVASRKREHAQKFAEEMGARFTLPIEPVESVEAAVRGSDLIVTATTAFEPILRREWLSPGVHLNVVGSSIPTTREVDTATMAAASLFVDRRESTLNEAGDYLFAMRALLGRSIFGPKSANCSSGPAQGEQRRRRLLSLNRWAWPWRI
jgi:ornithine cyclodeaminase